MAKPLWEKEADSFLKSEHGLCTTHSIPLSLTPLICKMGITIRVPTSQGCEIKSTQESTQERDFPSDPVAKIL